MPNLHGDPKSPKGPFKQKPIDPSRQVKFATVEDGPENQYDEHFETKSRSAACSRPEQLGKNIDPSLNGSRSANDGIKTGSAADYEPAKDNQPSSFPSVGPPPNNINNYGGGQWYTSADPSQSLGTAGWHLPGGAGWPNSHCGVSPTAHFQAPWGAHGPQHLVNNIAYSAFAPSPFPYQPNTVPIGQQGYVLSQQPAMMPQALSGQQQHVLVNGQAYPLAQGMPVPGMGGMPVGAGPPVMMNGGGGSPMTGNSSNPTPPDVSGLGKTQGEETMRQLQFAHANKLFEPQDFKPADDDPSRFYYVREVDGNWTQRNRFTIDHMGDCRWYVTDEGWFYAVRLPD